MTVLQLKLDEIIKKLYVLLIATFIIKISYQALIYITLQLEQKMLNVIDAKWCLWRVTDPNSGSFAYLYMSNILYRDTRMNLTLSIAIYVRRDSVLQFVYSSNTL